jgi:hypothetical protein
MTSSFAIFNSFSGPVFQISATFVVWFAHGINAGNRNAGSYFAKHYTLNSNRQPSPVEPEITNI